MIMILAIIIIMTINMIRIYIERIESLLTPSKRRSNVIWKENERGSGIGSI